METTFRLTIDRSALDQLTETTRAKLSRAIAKLARDIEGGAKTVVPVDTGFLKNSIQARPLDPLQWEVTVGAHYGAYVEFGTVRMPARPYLTPQIERLRPVLADVVRQAMAEAAREAGGK